MVNSHRLRNTASQLIIEQGVTSNHQATDQISWSPRPKDNVPIAGLIIGLVLYRQVNITLYPGNNDEV